MVAIVGLAALVVAAAAATTKPDPREAGSALRHRPLESFGRRGGAQRAPKRDATVRYATRRGRGAPSVSASELDGREVLLRLARAAADASNAVTLLTAGFAYHEVVANFLAAYERSGRRNWVVACLDGELGAWLADRGAACAPTVGRSKWAKVHAHIWTTRVQMLVSLLESGFSVTLADADAVFLGDAAPWLGRDKGDVVASRGSFPGWASEAWGATACMGLVRFNAGPKTLDFARSLLHQTRALGDDQKAVNAVLKRAGVAWARESGVAPRAPPLRYEGSALLATGDAGGLRVALLPHVLFQRRCPDDPPKGPAVVVKHCYTEKEAASKKAALAGAGAWLLRGDWRSVAATNGTSAWLAAIT